MERKVVCRYCGSDDMEGYHYIAYGEVAGVQIHYRFKCNECGAQQAKEKSQWVKELLKGKPWVKSKNAKLHQDKVDEFFNQFKRS